ncbi:MAG: hypothetical protein AAFW76_02785 [Pseudomonadota bacterium]
MKASEMVSRLTGLSSVSLFSIALIVLTACAPPRPMSQDRVKNVVSAESPYHFHSARRTLGQALIDERSGNAEQALNGFRQAAATWPGLTRAWRGIARTTNDAQERDAAQFVAARTQLVDPNDILTQRQMAQALRMYLDEQATTAEANPLTVEYGTQLASFYDDLYETRGTYEAPRAFGNIQPNEVPTAIITGVGTGIYLGTVLTGD